MPKDRCPEKPLIAGSRWVCLIVLHFSVFIGVFYLWILRGEVRLPDVFLLGASLWMNERNLRTGAVGIGSHVMSYTSSPFQYWLFVVGWYGIAAFFIWFSMLE